MTSSRVMAGVVLCAMVAFAQTPANRSQVSGTIGSVDAAANKIILKSDKGDDVTVTTSTRTLFLKMPPGETDPKKGAKIALDGLNAGDRAVVVAPQGSDPKNLAASAV